ncbi:MAG: ABC transporter ATP-binding protein [Pseudomonadota bacterium]
MTAPASPAYELNHVRHAYGGRPALEVDKLVLHRGSITGLIGPNGSGKSTLLNLLSFTLRPTSGKILYNGQPEHPFSKQVRSRISLLTQKPYLLKRTVFENTAYGLMIRGDRADLTQRVNQALESVGLDPGQFGRRKWHELSGGEAQRVALAARLVLEPRVLLLDEPTASVDTESALLIRNATLRARQDWGTTLVIASHDISWLSDISDSLLYLYKGKVFQTGREVIIPGPWTPAPDGQWCKNLGNGSRILVPEPPDPDATALVPSNHIRLTPLDTWNQPPGTGLKGTIVSMLLEKKTGNTIAGVKIEDLILSLNLEKTLARTLDLYPGKILGVTIQTRDVTWL